MANDFTCCVEEKLKYDGSIPEFYMSYVDYTLSKMPNITATTELLLTKLNGLHPNHNFTMELPVNNKISFVDMKMEKIRSKVQNQNS